MKLIMGEMSAAQLHDNHDLLSTIKSQNKRLLQIRNTPQSWSTPWAAVLYSLKEKKLTTAFRIGD